MVNVSVYALLKQGEHGRYFQFPFLLHGLCSVINAIEAKLTNPVLSAAKTLFLFTFHVTHQILFQDNYV